MKATDSTTIDRLIQLLLDPDKSISDGHLYCLSDITEEDLIKLIAAWDKLTIEQRLTLMTRLQHLSEKNSILSFEALCRFALTDEDSRIRELAVRTLQDYENNELIKIYMNLLDTDASTTVRKVAASALGRYIYLGEIEELSPKIQAEVENHLLNVYKGNDAISVRQCVLESLGYSSHKAIPGLIEEAYYSGKDDWIASSLLAMARSANNRWKELVQDMLDHDNLNVCLEAIRAAGELEIKDRIEKIVKFVENEDEEIRQAAIWSLSQIGGYEAQEILEELYNKTEDEEELELIELAFDNLAFTQDIDTFSMFDIEDFKENTNYHDNDL